MTEQEWLASTDPAAMLAWLTEAHKPAALRAAMPTDRKLRLFAVACCRQVWRHLNEGARESVLVAERHADGQATSKDRGLAFNAADSLRGFSRDWAYAVLRSDAEGGAREAIANACDDGWGIPSGTMASLLRDIVGNLWRPVTLPHDPACRVCDGTGRYLVGRGEDADSYRCRCCPWLTTTVVALAQTAYDERPGLACQCMRGGNPRHEWTGIMPALWRACTRCHGTGTIADGRLDPERLGVLADALEDAGCPTEESYTETVVPHSDCPQCSKPGRWRRGVGFEHERICTGERCWTSWQPGEAVEVRRKRPLLLLAHLRTPGPHWRGCWALDLLLGKA
jgi:hypothetical protein